MEAEPHHGRALEIAEMHYGAADPRTMLYARSLATVLSRDWEHVPGYPRDEVEFLGDYSGECSQGII